MGRCGGGEGGEGETRSQDPNVRDPRNGSILDMMRIERLKMDLQMGTPRRATQERDGAGGAGESSAEEVVTAKRSDITQGKCEEQTTLQGSFHGWAEALTLRTHPDFQGEPCQ